MHDVQTLATDSVYSGVDKWLECMFRGGLLICLGDDLGSNAIGGFFSVCFLVLSNILYNK